MWNLPPPPGFQGLRDDLPLHVYVRHLPHWRQPGATYFVTFRLGDSLPEARLHELRGLKVEFERKHPRPWSEEISEKYARQVTVRVEAWLDEGAGSCILRDGKVSDEVVRAMHHFDGKRFELGCYVVMPNHVHAVVRPLSAGPELEDIIGNWKSFSARQIRGGVEQESAYLWQEETYDRIIRDEEHLWRAIQYIGRNPRMAHLPRDEYRLWIRPEWVLLGWKFEAA